METFITHVVLLAQGFRQYLSIFDLEKCMTWALILFGLKSTYHTEHSLFVSEVTNPLIYKNAFWGTSGIYSRTSFIYNICK